jgi:hypothetical protein
VITLAWSVAGGLTILAGLAALLLWSVFFPASWAARLVVDRPEHIPEWLPRNDPQRMAAEYATQRWSA